MPSNEAVFQEAVRYLTELFDEIVKPPDTEAISQAAVNAQRAIQEVIGYSDDDRPLNASELYLAILAAANAKVAYAIASATSEVLKYDNVSVIIGKQPDVE